MDALLLVDIQKRFRARRRVGLCPKEIGSFRSSIRSSRGSELIVATQDWHPANHGSFAANHSGRKIGETIGPRRLAANLVADHCVQGSPGRRFRAGASKRSRAGRKFSKKEPIPEIDSYSGFFDNGHRKATGACPVSPRTPRHRSLRVAGLATDYCVKFTALDAVALGFQTWLIEDACRGVELQAGDVEKAVEEMRRARVKIVGSTNLSEGVRHD